MNRIKEAFNRGYTVSLEGKVYNKIGKEIGFVGAGGYFYIGIRINKDNINIPVHRLQAYQKYGEKMFDDGIEVRHLDGNPLNNSWDNILIGNHSDNMMDQSK
jgi:hypothetical protein